MLLSRSVLFSVASLYVENVAYFVLVVIVAPLFLFSTRPGRGRPQIQPVGHDPQGGGQSAGDRTKEKGTGVPFEQIALECCLKLVCQMLQECVRDVEPRLRLVCICIGAPVIFFFVLCYDRLYRAQCFRFSSPCRGIIVIAIYLNCNPGWYLLRDFTDYSGWEEGGGGGGRGRPQLPALLTISIASIQIFG